ncbi:MAG: 3-hydroxyacyl-CoA dehydrogenase family protein [Desulfobacteraceae bacterium]|nr:3-hydroxyacyl-CoA dehydrogenase family protein [Desulfobacteraceae bacterium]MBU4002419.1 3-hydroxyacyl-CoA dehydrogenase family protein [Pseudomonadota bacterium]MBU4054490.1 3-hydroxyacyl-CoA dehydrogenase family protein [Pseudomonadota bacterium]
MKLQDVKCIGILGGGVMGGGIGQCAIQVGQRVIIRDLNEDILQKTKDNIVESRFGFKKAIEMGKMTQAEMDKALSLLTLTTKVEDMKDCDIIIEAIGGGEGGRLENKPLKLKVFAEMDELVKKTAVFASNTSMFTIADLAEATKRKPLFAGFHLFSPANIMKLVEITSTKDTLPEVAELLADLSKSWGKTPILLKDVPGDKGFIGNRVMSAVRRECMEIIKEGVGTAEDINLAMTLGFRWPAGPMPTGGPGARSGWK